MVSRDMWSSGTGFFREHDYFQGSFMLWPVLALLSIFWPKGIAFMDRTHFVEPFVS